MRVVLVLPPAFEPTQPYSSLPCLTAVLRRAGHYVYQCDVNVESYAHLLSPSYLRRCTARLNEFVVRCEEIDHLVLADQERYSLSKKSAAASAYLTKEISGALDTIRDRERFRDFALCSHAYNVVKRSLELVSAAHYPTRVELYEARFGHRPESSRDAYRTALDAAVNPYLGWFQDEVVPEVLSDEPDLVGLSVVTIDMFVPALSLATLIKRLRPETFVVFGGPFVAQVIDHLETPERLFEIADAVVVREGETALLELLDKLQRRAPLDDVKNIRIMRDGKLVCGPSYDEDFAAIPTPDFDGLPLDSYLSPERVLPYSTSRGCYYHKCAFCSHFYPFNRYGTATPERAHAELSSLAEKYETTFFSFNDEAIPPRWLLRFGDLVRRGSTCLKWYTFCRLERTLDRPTLEQMADGGCRMLMFGFESGSERVLRIMKKGTTLSAIERILRDCAELGIAIRLDVLVGFPGESLKESDTTLDFIRRNREILDTPFSVPPISRFELYRGTAVYCFPDRFGVTIAPTLPNGDLELEQRYRVSSGMTMMDAERQYRKYVRYFVQHFGQYKLMPDSKSQSFLYKCLDDEGRLRGGSPHRRRVVEDLGPPKATWLGVVALAPTVVTIESGFDLELICDNVRWLVDEATYESLEEWTALSDTAEKIAKNAAGRLVPASHKRTYLLDVATLRAVELTPTAVWIAQQLPQVETLEDFGSRVKDSWSFVPSQQEVFELMLLLDRQGLLVIAAELDRTPRLLRGGTTVGAP